MASEVIERDLYNGKYKMVHNPNARGRAPRYKVNDTEKPKGVTTILGKVIAKDLMSWAVACAVEYLTEKLPVVTLDDLEIASHEYEVKRDAGGSTGTEAHALVEALLKGRSPAVNSASEEAQNAYGAFYTWYKTTKPTIINVEEVVYSEEFNYAGTYDGMMEIDGKVYLTDLKTTNSSRTAPQGVYAENFLQLGAYALAHEEQRLYEEKNGGSKLLPIAGLMVISCKKNGNLDIVTNQDVGLSVDDCKRMFKAVMNIYTFLEFVTGKLKEI